MSWCRRASVRLARRQMLQRVIAAGHKNPRISFRKVNKKKFDEMLLNKFGKEHDTVRIEEWIEPPTLAVMQHPNVAAFVNHGGASKLDILLA